MTLRGVFILLCTAAAEIHPPHVVPVCYPVVGTKAVASTVCRGVSTHRTWEEKVRRKRRDGGRGGMEVIERVGGGGEREQEGN